MVACRLLFSSADAVQSLADAYTLMQPCKALGIPTRNCLTDALHELE
jgi:hypothetical protein